MNFIYYVGEGKDFGIYDNDNTTPRSMVHFFFLQKKDQLDKMG